jgi:hypothetical protein
MITRNKRLAYLFVFRARKMLLTVLRADECGVVWHYVFGVKNFINADSRRVEKVRAEFADVVEERRRRAAIAVNAVAADADEDGIATRVVKRRRRTVR